MDIIVGNVGHVNELYINAGTGDFTFISSVGRDWGSLKHRGDTFALGMLDVDGDLDMDIYAGNFKDPDGLFINDGTGTTNRLSLRKAPIFLKLSKHRHYYQALVHGSTALRLSLTAAQGVF